MLLVLLLTPHRQCELHGALVSASAIGRRAEISDGNTIKDVADSTALGWLADFCAAEVLLFRFAAPVRRQSV